MTLIKTCLWCGEKFEPRHGNNEFCSTGCQDQAKRERQKQKRDPIKNFIPILIKNHEILDRIFNEGKTVISSAEVEAYDLDISLCRYLHPPPEHLGKILLDFGVFYLITESDFKTFKIYKHATSITI